MFDKAINRLNINMFKRDKIYSEFTDELHFFCDFQLNTLISLKMWI